MTTQRYRVWVAIRDGARCLDDMQGIATRTQLRNAVRTLKLAGVIRVEKKRFSPISGKEWLPSMLGKSEGSRKALRVRVVKTEPKPADRLMWAKTELEMCWPERGPQCV